MKKDTKDPTLETIQKCVKKTLSYKRYSAYLDWLITDSEFKNEVRLLRKKYKIPPQGWKINQSGNVENDELYIFFKDKNNSKSFRFDVDGLSRNFDLPDTWSSHISHYVLHNDINHTSNFTPTFDLIDLKYCTSGPYKDDAAKKIAQQFLSTTIKDTSQTHPIALLFTPYVSQTELVDYIKKMYKEVIEVYQEKYKRDEIQLGRIRQKSALADHS